MNLANLKNRVRAVFNDYRVQSGKPLNQLTVKNNDDQADIYIYDVIDSWWGIGASEIISAISDISAPVINVHIHSPGGDVFEGAAIMSALANHSSKIITHNDGLAASMASGLMMAGTQRFMSEGAFLMIHEPWSIAAGTAKEFREFADFLDKHTENLAKNYSKRTIASGGLSHEQILDAMAEDTWYTAEEAVAAGLIDEITETIPVEDQWSASALLSECKNTPEKIRALVNATEERRVETQKQFTQFLRDELDMPANMAKSVAKNGFHPELPGEAGAGETELLNEAELTELSNELDSLYINLRL